MATIQMDLPSANRFVSSLSKSLQALCHGCMDFDTDIEIVGYINVNIDSGSKVDYVLNEKVSKSTNNSMKFVSNSFLAKKDMPKTERSCSPIPELNIRPVSRGSSSSSYSSSQLYKSSGIFSPHSQVLRGSQKRSWSGGDWRSSHRKMAKGPRSQYDPSSYNTQSQPQHSEYDSQQTSSFSKPSTSQPEYYSESTLPHANVKSEVADETGDSYDQNIPSMESGALVSDIHIKADPDSAEVDNAASFLHDQTAGGNSESKQNSDQKTSESDSFLKTEQEDSSAFAANEGQESGDYNDEQTNNGASAFSDEPDVTFQTEDGQEYAGEESGDGSQFDIIEIDDEDEDLAAFTGNNTETGSTTSANQARTPAGAPIGSHHRVKPEEAFAFGFTGTGTPPSNPFKFKCMFCHRGFVEKFVYQQHLAKFHREDIPNHCTMCEKVFLSESALKRHMVEHGNPKFVCQFCEAKFKRNYVLQSHLRSKHKLYPCQMCPYLSLSQEEFNNHVLHCIKS